ncbi:MAG: MATE family efflux transporter [Gemmatimonadaceae bacterium]|nr:MATE family efflux transporter [Gemmatimonadaceae bacterium]
MTQPAAASTASIKTVSPTGTVRKFDRSIVEGPIGPAVWKIAWPTVLQNVIGGLQGIIDHVMVGHLVGFTGNAAIGVSFQIFLVVVVFLGSLFTGMAVLVARFTGAGDAVAVNRAASQAFLVAITLSVGVVAPVGYFAAPYLLGMINAAPAVQAEALSFLRIMLVFNFGMMMFFMLGSGLRAAGDAKTPLRLGVAMTAMNIGLNVVFICGLGPIPSFGTAGAAMGTVISGGVIAIYSVTQLFRGVWVLDFRHVSWRPDWEIIRALFRFGLPAGLQGIAMNVAGVLILRFVGSTASSAAAQAAYAIAYTELFSLVTWTSVGLMGATSAVAGQNLGAGKPERSGQAVLAANKIGLIIAATVGLLFWIIPTQLLGLFGMQQPEVLRIGTELLAFLAVSGLFITTALTYTGGLQGTGDTKSPLYISLISQFALPIGYMATIQLTRQLVPSDVWLAIVMGHALRCVLSVWRFRQGRWHSISLGVKPK